MKIKPLFFRTLGAVALVLFVGPSVKDDLHFWTVYFTGKHASGTPISVHSQHIGRYNHYFGRLEFISGDGVPVTGMRPLTFDLRDEFDAHRPVPLRYDARDPSDFVLEGERAVWPAVLWSVIVSLFLLGYAALFLFSWYLSRPVVPRVRRKPRAKKVKRGARRDKHYHY